MSKVLETPVPNNLTAASTSTITTPCNDAPNNTTITHDHPYERQNCPMHLMRWEAALPFNVELYGNVKTPDHNILQMVPTQFKMIPTNIYFSSEKYPSTLGFQSPGWKLLLQDLKGTSQTHGYSIFSNGCGYSKSSPNGHRVLKCTHGVVYRKQMPGPRKTSNKRKSSTQRPLTKDSCCPFAFHISYDDSGFYLVNGKGCSFHHGHPEIKGPVTKQSVKQDTKRF